MDILSERNADLNLADQQLRLETDSNTVQVYEGQRNGKHAEEPNARL
jgi:hypothetical protein